MKWWWWETRRARKAADRAADRDRAEALVEVERRGMMGGKPPEMRLTPVERPPRLRPVIEPWTAPSITYDPPGGHIGD